MYGPKTVLVTEKERFLWLDLEIEILEMFQYQLNPVQHLVSRAAKDTDVIEIEQECEILLIPKTHLHEMTKTSSCIRQTKRHATHRDQMSLHRKLFYGCQPHPWPIANNLGPNQKR